MALAVGDKAPDFSLPGNGGALVSLADFAGKNFVLYFYPKDDTPGCTVEAKDFTSMAPEFQAANTAIVGASKDSVAKHDKFMLKHALDVTLISDTEGTLVEAYEVWVQKKLYGREYMGIERATYLIDQNGIIQHIWRKVRVKNHAEAVLVAAKAL